MAALALYFACFYSVQEWEKVDRSGFLWFSEGESGRIGHLVPTNQAIAL